MRVRLLVLAFAVMLVSAACGPVDWLMFQFGPDRTGFSPDTSITKTAVQGSMVLNWSAATGGAVGSPVVANGVVYVGSYDDHKLYAFDAAGGSATCSGSPKSCTPLWTAPTGGPVADPAVVNGVVYVGSGDGKLYAFDAAGGSATCSGSPKTCTPLWTAATGGAVGSAPAVVGGVVYIGSNDDKLYAFDAAGGSATCSGSPKTCTPLWTATSGAPVSSPAVANGVVYAVSSGAAKLAAYDAAGSTNCSGTPKTCSPLWTADAGLPVGTPAVANGVVYVGGFDTNAGTGKLYAFDAAGGSATCSGSPKTCTPLWSGATYDTPATPAVANGVVYVNAGNLYAFDAAGGSTTCSGSPKTCTPLWTAHPAATGLGPGPPAVANGVLYVQFDERLSAFDAAGSTNCSGSPKTCSPLWTVANAAIVSSPVVENGVVYAGTYRFCDPHGICGGENKLYAFGLEKIPPTTSVVIPSNGKTVSGTNTLLDASASDDVSVSRVEFHLTGGSYHDALIGVATSTQYGWIYHWDTTSVPNGSYTLNSVATDPAGNVGRSAGVSVMVGN